MRKKLSSLISSPARRVNSILPDSAFQPPPEDGVLRKRLRILLAAWGVCWFLLPLAVLALSELTKFFTKNIKN